MTGSIEIPVWLAVIATLFAFVAVLDRVLAPGVRWLFRKRVNRAIDELNDRLQLRIQPFKLTRRQVLIDRLLHDPEVAAAIEDHATETGTPRAVAAEQAARYAREITPAFSATAYFTVGARISRWVSQALYRVRIGYSNEQALRAIDPEATVIFVMNHRSNMDYVLVTYLAASRSALSYAVGEWARVWMLQGLIRMMGAYFIRRRSRNALYRKVLARYVQMATYGGVTQAIFPEGGLSRDGALREPKLGLLSYIVNGFEPDGPRDVVFVPIGLNYDRVLEDRILTTASEGETPRFNVSILQSAAFAARLLWLRLTGRFYRFGYACVSFGDPLSLREFSEQGADAAALGDELLSRVGAVIPALPVSLVASIFSTGSETGLGMLEIKARVWRLAERIEAAGGYIHVPRGDRDYGVETGVRMLLMRRLIVEEDGLYRAASDEDALLAYYARSIAHLPGFAQPAGEPT